ncbi:T9SS type A sorting domain-containing protein, partial [candidate division KSB1 bacterium]|nr:T9SS type A sorting domain-containing protein [candidate division KSB1 bacterium]
LYETVTLEFTVTNTHASYSATNIAFTDNLSGSGLWPHNLPLNDICGPGSQISGTNILSFTRGSLAPNSSATFSIDLSIPAGGLQTPSFFNSTSPITATLNNSTRTGDPATAYLQINLLEFTKQFTDPPAVPGGSVPLVFTITNYSVVPLAGLSFSDNLNTVLPGLSAIGLPANDVCGTGSQLSGTNFLQLTGGSLSSLEFCTFSVVLQVPPSAAPGIYTNTASNIFMGGLSISNSATAALGITQPIPIRLVSFTAERVPEAGIIVKWTPENEINMAGFYIAKCIEKNGTYERIHPSIIPSVGHNHTTQCYEYMDMEETGEATYWYKLEEVDLHGKSSFYGPVGITNTAAPPTGYSLQQNFPNPFNSATQLRYSLAKEGRINLDIYNIRGERVRQLMDKSQPAGTFNIVWDGKLDNRKDAVSGQYVCVLSVDGYVLSRKIVLLR